MGRTSFVRALWYRTTTSVLDSKHCIRFFCLLRCKASRGAGGQCWNDGHTLQDESVLLLQHSTPPRSPDYMCAVLATLRVPSLMGTIRTVHRSRQAAAAAAALMVQ